MALKVRCVWCDTITTYDPETGNYICSSCGTTIQLPSTVNPEGSPYQGWQSVYESDKRRKKPGSHSSSSGRKRKPPAKPPARYSSDFYNV